MQLNVIICSSDHPDEDKLLVVAYDAMVSPTHGRRKERKKSHLDHEDRENHLVARK